MNNKEITEKRESEILNTIEKYIKNQINGDGLISVSKYINGYSYFDSNNIIVINNKVAVGYSCITTLVDDETKVRLYLVRGEKQSSFRNRVINQYGNSIKFTNYLDYVGKIENENILNFAKDKLEKIDALVEQNNINEVIEKLYYSPEFNKLKDETKN